MNIEHYLMENTEESTRLELKTDPEPVKKQALWAGIRSGMRVADIGCGPGKTTSILYELVKPGGEAVGIDFSRNRYDYAKNHYVEPGLHFICRDAREELQDLGRFDFLWVRFLLEYYLVGGSQLVENITKILKPGGILCLMDLDYNCLSHYGIPDRLEKTIFAITEILQKKANFDPYAGRKLYSYFYDLGYEEIKVDISAHHVIYGSLNDTDAFNWMKKIEVVPPKIGYPFTEYNGSYEAFVQECTSFFHHPRRFTYTPLIACCGRKPLSS